MNSIRKSSWYVLSSSQKLITKYLGVSTYTVKPSHFPLHLNTWLMLPNIVRPSVPPGDARGQSTPLFPCLPFCLLSHSHPFPQWFFWMIPWLFLNLYTIKVSCFPPTTYFVFLHILHTPELVSLKVGKSSYQHSLLFRFFCRSVLFTLTWIFMFLTFPSPMPFLPSIHCLSH